MNTITTTEQTEGLQELFPTQPRAKTQRGKEFVEGKNEAYLEVLEYLERDNRLTLERLKLTPNRLRTYAFSSINELKRYKTKYLELERVVNRLRTLSLPFEGE